MWAENVQVIIAGMMFLVTAAYVFLTIRLVRANELMVAPQVCVSLARNPKVDRSIRLVIRNCGVSVATNVCLKFPPGLRYRGTATDLLALRQFADSFDLAPGQEMGIVVTDDLTLTEELRSKGLIVTVLYRNTRGRRFKRTIGLNVAGILETGAYSDMSLADIGAELRMIRLVLEKMNEPDKDTGE